MPPTSHTKKHSPGAEASGTAAATPDSARPATDNEQGSGRTDGIAKLSLQSKPVSTSSMDAEDEANMISGDIMRIPEQSFVQLKTAEDEELNLQRAPANEGAGGLPSIQGGVLPATQSLAASLQSSRGGGNALDVKASSFMQTRFGTDFSKVRIHADTESARLSKGLNAKAFTLGNDVYFNEGQYQPNTRQGKQLLAHELTHVVQQQSTVRKKIMRTVNDAEVEADFQKWAAANSVKVNKNGIDYPHDLWTFIATLIMDPSGTGPKAKPPSKDAQQLNEWTKNFEKGGIVIKWLIALKNTTQSDAVKSAADSRALGIMDLMAQAGLVSGAMAQSGALSDENKKFLFDTVLKNPASASPAELETITAFQCAALADPAEVAIVKTLTNGGKSPLKTLDAARTKAILKTLVTKYGNHAKVVDAIAELFMFNPAIRTALSDSLMASEFGNPELLFKVLKHPYFIEPEYGARILTAVQPTDMSSEDYEKKRMKDDMPWVYTYKQKYYVQYLIDLAKGQGIDIAPPASMTFAALKSWLEKNTESIADAANKKYPSTPEAIFQIYRNIADIFFFHVPHERDVAPDLEGKISHLKEGAPSKKRFEADCDVFATYAMRLFSNGGFEPVGYMAFVPTGADASRAAHVAAMVRKAGSYYIINNKGVLDAVVSETKADDQKTEALKAMRKLAFEDAYGAPRPTSLKIFYANSGIKGQMTKLFKDQDSSLERADLK